MTDFRQKCLAKAKLIGTFAAIPHPVAVEVTARSGLDFLCIDWEHAQIARDTIENMVRASDVHHVPAMVRVPGHGQEAIAAALDSGAQGVLVPRVSTAAQALAAVKAARYPPLGERGVGPGRAAGYGYRIFEYLAGRERRSGGRGPGGDCRRARQCRRDCGDGRRRRGLRRSWRPVGVDRRHGSSRRKETHARRSRRSSRLRWPTARSQASSARGPRMSANGQRRARASSSWPAIRCFSGPALRQAAPPRATAWERAKTLEQP